MSLASLDQDADWGIQQMSMFFSDSSHLDELVHTTAEHLNSFHISQPHMNCLLFWSFLTPRAGPLSSLSSSDLCCPVPHTQLHPNEAAVNLPLTLPVEPRKVLLHLCSSQSFKDRESPCNVHLLSYWRPLFWFQQDDFLSGKPFFILYPEISDTGNLSLPLA